MAQELVSVQAPDSLMRVAAWSPHKPLARGLQELLATSFDIEPVLLSETCSLLESLSESQVEVLVLDVDQSPQGAAALIHQIADAAPDVRLVALSTHPDARLIERALNAGAVGYIVKDRVFEELLIGVRAAARNERYVSPAVANSTTQVA